MTTNFALTNMIKQQLRTGDVLSENILSLYDKIPREDFVPQKMQPFAYSDMQIPLLHKQKMMTPLEESFILQALNLKGHETVLEVGTGSGFFTALLSQLCSKVISIDYYEQFTESAATALAKHSCNNVELLTADASQGWLEKAPYDVIIITGSIEKISETHRLQVLPGGKICAIVGKAPIMQAILESCDQQGIWSSEFLFNTYLPPLINPLKHEEFIF